MSTANSSLTIFFFEPRLSKMIGYSISLHLLLFGLLVGLPPSSQRDMNFVPFYTVDLVNLPSTIPSGSTRTGVETSKSLALPKQTMDSPKSALKEKKSAQELDATIAKIREKVAKERSRAGEEEIAKTISQIREKISVKGQGGVTDMKGTSSGPAGAQALSNLTPGSYQMNLYLTAIWEKIRSSWTLTESLMPAKKDIESIIAIKIRKNGEIVDTNFEKRSGNRYLDESAMRAIKKANPLPPLPDGFHEEYLEIGIRFHPSDLG
jgi:TonB family protein